MHSSAHSHVLCAEVIVFTAQLGLFVYLNDELVGAEEFQRNHFKEGKSNIHD